jgi:hypothetical protein
MRVWVSVMSSRRESGNSIEGQSSTILFLRWDLVADSRSDIVSLGVTRHSYFGIKGVEYG